jgi:hypothetical protein
LKKYYSTGKKASKKRFVGFVADFYQKNGSWKESPELSCGLPKKIFSILLNFPPCARLFFVIT